MVAMNREEVDHGSQGKSEKVEIEKESQEGCREEENRHEALHAEEKVCCQEKESSAEESAGEKEIRAKESRIAKTCPEAGSAEARSAKACGRSAAASGRRAGTGIAEPGHLSPVQPAGGRRQSG
jgi:hypothetical protein